MNFEGADDNFYHEVPAAGHFYMGTQCYHCENPPCVDVCPVGATWQEDDGIEAAQKGKSTCRLGVSFQEYARQRERTLVERNQSKKHRQFQDCK